MTHVYFLGVHSELDFGCSVFFNNSFFMRISTLPTTAIGHGFSFEFGANIRNFYISNHLIELWVAQVDYFDTKSGSF